MHTKKSIVVMANKKYIVHFDEMHHQIRDIGNYDGDIVLLTDGKTNCTKVKKLNDSKLSISRFEQIKFSKNTNKSLNMIEFGRNKDKPFQWNKFYLFHEYFKQWNYIFYLDINMRIHGDINDLLKLGTVNTLYAPYDAYPNLDWTLATQFDNKSAILGDLKNNYNLKNRKYFQTGILFYDTSIIKKSTFKKLYNLTEKYPISKTNEQGIMNLFFLYDYPVFKRLPEEVNFKKTYTYWKLKDTDSVITKRDQIEAT